MYEDFRVALSLDEELAAMERTCFEGFLDGVAEYVDQKSTKTRRRNQDEHQPTFPGMQFDEDGVYRLGGGRRVDKLNATIDHMEIAIALNDENLIAVQQANLEMRKEYLTLKPYWKGRTRKRQAIAAYRTANPEG